MQTEFFLGANSKDGFYSRYDQLIDPARARAVFLIKGSPGCGKSSFMRRVAEGLSDLPREAILCASDAGSLDGLVFPTLGVAFADATAPHVLEPSFPLAVEQYVNLGEHVDVAALPRDEIIAATRAYKARWSRIYRLTSCAGTVANDLFALAAEGVAAGRMAKKAAGIASREFFDTGRPGRAIGRFLSALSPDGYLTLFHTISSLSERVYALEDSFGVGAALLEELKTRAVARGHTVYAAYSPLLPDRMEHLLLPELKLAYVTTNKRAPLPFDPTRRIRIDAMLAPEVLREHRQKLRFGKNLLGGLIDEACRELAAAKALHDGLEALYNPAVDFDAITARADALAARLR